MIKTLAGINIAINPRVYYGKFVYKVVLLSHYQALSLFGAEGEITSAIYAFIKNMPKDKVRSRTEFTRSFFFMDRVDAERFVEEFLLFVIEISWNPVSDIIKSMTLPISYSNRQNIDRICEKSFAIGFSLKQINLNFLKEYFRTNLTMDNIDRKVLVYQLASFASGTFIYFQNTQEAILFKLSHHDLIKHEIKFGNGTAHTINEGLDNAQKFSRSFNS